MPLQFDHTAELTNTRYAPLAALLAYYEAENVLKPLASVSSEERGSEYPLSEKLEQVLISILADCPYLSLVNTKLGPERHLAQVKRIERFADQSTLSRGLDALTQSNLEHLEHAVRQISARASQTRRHDGRAFLELDFDLSALPCGPQAQKGRKGYSSGKKTVSYAN
ncbi:MAG: hypothetical protein KDD73_17345 [Anaerolineales bacterium]|nr:hypothetical protein [Anaerolineales bacterium]MCB9127691.1 hypothetical protein [Ardenticatenales bacterium]MCB9128974.1 hypothetical protein [Ardenticatenales bacterium]